MGVKRPKYLFKNRLKLLIGSVTVWVTVCHWLDGLSILTVVLG